MSAFRPLAQELLILGPVEARQPKASDRDWTDLEPRRVKRRANRRLECLPRGCVANRLGVRGTGLAFTDRHAVVAAQERNSGSSAAMNDGRVLSGILRSQSEQTLTLQTPTEKLMLNRADVEKIQPTQLSLMPDGLLDPLNPTEVRDLFAYLMSSSQVPLSRNAQ